MSSILLKWDNQGAGAEYRIYRSTTFIDVDVLPAPLANVITEEYDDTSVSHGETFYYVIESIIGGVSTFSGNKIITCLENVYVQEGTNLHKVDAFGNTTWTITVGTGVKGIETDNAGNVFIFFSSGNVSCFDSNGEFVWDATGLLTSLYDYTVIKDTVCIVGQDNTSSTFTSNTEGFIYLNSTTGAPQVKTGLANIPISMTSTNNKVYIYTMNGSIVHVDSAGTVVETGNRAESTNNVTLKAAGGLLYMGVDGTSIKVIDPANSYLNATDAIARSYSDIEVSGDNVLFIAELGVNGLSTIKSDYWNGWSYKEYSDPLHVTIDKSKNAFVAYVDKLVKVNNKGFKLWELAVPNINHLASDPGENWL